MLNSSVLRLCVEQLLAKMEECSRYVQRPQEMLSYRV